mmetsp:Transcript_62991/g.136767  ORF Transcript_62991/g.136767 Transcript_62991/m.136767 type:complete len:277 (-) Transcript_62991:44-874(-)
MSLCLVQMFTTVCRSMSFTRGNTGTQGVSPASDTLAATASRSAASLRSAPTLSMSCRINAARDESVLAPSALHILKSVMATVDLDDGAPLHASSRRTTTGRAPVSSCSGDLIASNWGPISLMRLSVCWVLRRSKWLSRRAVAFDARTEFSFVPICMICSSTRLKSAGSRLSSSGVMRESRLLSTASLSRSIDVNASASLPFVCTTITKALQSSSAQDFMTSSCSSPTPLGCSLHLLCTSARSSWYCFVEPQHPMRRLRLRLASPANGAARSQRSEL